MSAETQIKTRRTNGTVVVDVEATMASLGFKFQKRGSPYIREISEGYVLAGDFENEHIGHPGNSVHVEVWSNENPYRPMVKFQFPNFTAFVEGFQE